jgi:hypothetical protein
MCRLKSQTAFMHSGGLPAQRWRNEKPMTIPIQKGEYEQSSAFHRFNAGADALSPKSCLLDRLVTYPKERSGTADRIIFLALCQVSFANFS